MGRRRGVKMAWHGGGGGVAAACTAANGVATLRHPAASVNDSDDKRGVAWRDAWRGGVAAAKINDNKSMEKRHRQLADGVI